MDLRESRHPQCANPLHQLPRPCPLPCWPSSAPGHSLSQARDLSARSLSSLLALLARSDASRPLGARSRLARLLHRITPDSSFPRSQEHTASTSRTIQPVRRGGGPTKEGSCKTSSSRPEEEWVLQHLLPSSQARWWPQAHLESEILQFYCLPDFIQDVDSQICNRSHEAMPVDGQCGSEGRLLPHQSISGSLPVPQVPVAGAVLPVRGSSLWTVLAPRVFTKTLPHWWLGCG